jgi:hypothetical protein
MINWVLILIVYWNGSVMTTGDGVFKTIIECFEAREVLVAEIGGRDGIPPNNMQAVCIANDTSAGMPTFPM